MGGVGSFMFCGGCFGSCLPAAGMPLGCSVPVLHSHWSACLHAVLNHAKNGFFCCRFSVHIHMCQEHPQPCVDLDIWVSFPSAGVLCLPELALAAEKRM